MSGLTARMFHGTGHHLLPQLDLTEGRAAQLFKTPQNLSGRISAACQVSRVLQPLRGRRGDPAVRVSRDMVPPRGTRLRVSHIPVLVGWTSFQWVLHHLPGLLVPPR